MLKKLFRMLTAMSMIVVITGCMTILTLSAAEKETKCGGDCNIPRIYSGTAADICGLAADNLGLFALIDLPLSIAGDTLMLPYAYYAQSKYGNISVKAPCAPKDVK